MQKERIFTIPNLLSFYRFLSFPFILWFIIGDKETLFVIFIIINLITDALDGYLARKLDQETEFGARLDSTADKLTYALAITGIFVFKLEELRPHLFVFYIFIILGVTYLVHSFIKFGRISSLHTYATKIGGYMQGVFFFVLFIYDFIPIFFYIVMIWGIISILEMIVIQLIIPEMRSNVKGLYWVLKDRSAKDQ